MTLRFYRIYSCLLCFPRPLYVTVVYQGKCSHCMRIGVAVPLTSTVSRLREAVSLETKIPTDQVLTSASLAKSALPAPTSKPHCGRKISWGEMWCGVLLSQRSASLLRLVVLC